MNERQTAFRILNKIERNHAYSNLVLDSELKEAAGNKPFSGLVTALVYGVTERKITLDFFLSSFLKQPIKKLRPEVLTALRMGVYQLKFMDKIPPSAAVNESVKLVKSNGCAYASGLVNSVLRKVSLADIQYPNTGNLAYDFSVRYSCPEPLVEHYIQDYGEEDAKEILRSSLGAAPLTVRVNTLKTTIKVLISSLQEEGVTATEGVLPDTLVLENAGAPEKLKAYANGLFHVQDLASAYCVRALDLQPGQTLLDVCAAPGGKSFTAAQELENTGKVFSFDLYPQRVKLIEDGAKRLSITNLTAKVGDASKADESLFGVADRVLCDVPCSGLGTIRRKPEIRYKDLSFIDNLTDLQYNILTNASSYLRADGQLVYSTCTLNRAENEAVCDRFLENHPEFEKTDDYKTLMPHKNGTDGFFIARLRRKHGN